MTPTTPTQSSSWRATRFGRTIAAVALSTLAVVTLASGAFAQLADTVDLLGFSVTSNNASTTPPTPIVDLVVGDGDCSVAQLNDSTVTSVAFSPSVDTLDVAGMIDQTNLWVSATLGEFCVKSESSVPATMTLGIIGPFSGEDGDVCTPGSPEELGEIAMWGTPTCDTPAPSGGELALIADVLVSCDNAHADAWDHMGMSAGGSQTSLAPGQMTTCSVEVHADGMLHTPEVLQAALTDTFYFDLFVTGEQI